VTVDDLQPEQALKLRETVARQLRFVSRLCRRLDVLGFPPSDPLWRAACRARDGLHELHVAAHYAAVKKGVGRRAG